MRDGRGGEYRDETPGERVDRQWGELLQELRVMQTGAQLTAGFLLTLPFTPAFRDLDQLQRGLYLTLVLLAGLITILVLTPVATHRRLSGEHVKERLVLAAHRVVTVVLGLLSALVVGMVVLIVDIAVGRAAALATGAVTSAVVVVLMVLLPARLARHSRSVDE
jgi:hypothetical protein